MVEILLEGEVWRKEGDPKPGKEEELWRLSDRRELR